MHLLQVKKNPIPRMSLGIDICCVCLGASRDASPKSMSILVFFMWSTSNIYDALKKININAFLDISYAYENASPD